MTDIWEIRNGRVVTPTGVIEDGCVVVTENRISAVSQTPAEPLSHARTINADSRIVMPGLIDLHGDDIEHHLAPRSGAKVDLQTALTTADRANLFNGVTTKFHAVAFEDAPEDNRSLEAAESLAGELAEEKYTLSDNRLHARCELTDASVNSVEQVIDDVDFLSIMHHAPGGGQYDQEEFERHYIEDRNWPTEIVKEVATARQSIGAATRHERVSRLAELARDAGVPLASHDDESPGAVETMADYGATISEYPLTIEAARRATDLGLTTVMGAPNLVRDGSLWDNLNARTAIDHNAVDVLSADYHPPSLLAAPFVETGEPLATRVNRVTRNPADVVGLTDRGRIEVGARADLIVVDQHPTPTVECALVAGTEAVRTDHPSRSPNQTQRANL